MTKVITVSQARSNIYKIMDETAQTHLPVLITGKRNNVVMLSEEDWNAIEETLFLNAIPGMASSIKEAIQALKDAKNLSSASLDKKAKELIEIIKKDPFQKPPPYEKLVGNLSGSYSRRINIKHRIVYEVIDDEKLVRISRMWTRYGE